MKKLLIIAAAVVAMVGCKSKQTEPQEVTVSFQVENLQVTTAAMAPHRAGSLTDAKIKNLYVLVNGELKKAQAATDTDFGTFTLSLKYGVQTIDIIGGTRDGQAVTNGVWSCDKVDGTYAATLELDVTPGTGAQNIVLQHIDYSIYWLSTDKMPEEVYSVKLGIKDWHGSLGKGLIPATTEDKEVEINVTTKQGKILEVMMGGLCSTPFAEEYEQVVATFTALSENGDVLYHFEKQVPVKSNTKTTITGRMFGYNEQPILSVSTNYAEEKTIDL